MPAERYLTDPDSGRREPDTIRPPAPSTPSGGKDLTLDKLLAGAAAAATSALVGSFFGVEGTVLGAAVGSAVSTIATALYQRSLDRTRDTVRARIRLPGGRTVDVAAPADVPAPRVSPEGETGCARVHVTPAPNRAGPTPGAGHGRAGALLVISGLVFVLSLLLVTGLELLTGSPLSGGEPGTSIGRVLEGDDPAPTGPRGIPAPPTTPAESTDTTATTDASPSPTPTAETEAPPQEQPDEPVTTVAPSGDGESPAGDGPRDPETSVTEEPPPTADVREEETRGADGVHVVTS